MAGENQLEESPNQLDLNEDSLDVANSYKEHSETPLLQGGQGLFLMYCTQISIQQAILALEVDV